MVKSLEKPGWLIKYVSKITENEAKEKYYGFFSIFIIWNFRC